MNENTNTSAETVETVDVEQSIPVDPNAYVLNLEAELVKVKSERDYWQKLAGEWQKLAGEWQKLAGEQNY